MTAFTYTDRTGDAEWRESTHEERRKAAQRGSSAHAQRGSTQCKDAAAAHRPLNLLLAIVDADANLDDEPTLDARLADAYAVRVDARLRSKHPMNHQAHEGAQDEQPEGDSKNLPEKEKRENLNYSVRILLTRDEVAGSARDGPAHNTIPERYWSARRSDVLQPTASSGGEKSAL